jgi:hypothetical protein
MVNPVFGADGGNPLHIWSARLCKFLSATRKKRFKARRMCLDKHPAWSVPDILEGVNHVSRHEHDASVPPHANDRRGILLSPAEPKTIRPRSRDNAVAGRRRAE